MDLEPSWRIETPIPDGKSYTSAEAWMVDFDEDFAIVPDTRLQAIAGAPRCEHDRIDKHDYQGKVEGGWHTMICEGAPKLRALLKALSEENNDDKGEA